MAKFKRFDLVETPKGKMAIQGEWAQILMPEGGWVQEYICCPLNKDNKTINLRKLDKRCNL